MRKIPFAGVKHLHKISCHAEEYDIVQINTFPENAVNKYRYLYLIEKKPHQAGTSSGWRASVRHVGTRAAPSKSWNTKNQNAITSFTRALGMCEPVNPKRRGRPSGAQQTCHICFGAHVGRGDGKCKRGAECKIGGRRDPCQSAEQMCQCDDCDNEDRKMGSEKLGPTFTSSQYKEAGMALRYSDGVVKRKRSQAAAARAASARGGAALHESGDDNVTDRRKQDTH